MRKSLLFAENLLPESERSKWRRRICSDEDLERDEGARFVLDALDLLLELREGFVGILFGRHAWQLGRRPIVIASRR